jgi:hypothetical protein
MSVNAKPLVSPALIWGVAFALELPRVIAQTQDPNPTRFHHHAPTLWFSHEMTDAARLAAHGVFSSREAWRYWPLQ